jgi:hypothetical protein
VHRPPLFTSLLSATFVVGAASTAFAGGAWVPAPGHSDFQLGFSRKTAGSSWSRTGEKYDNANSQGNISEHDFRYVYLSGEVGVVNRLSARFLMTWLYGIEGVVGNQEINKGFSDAWFGAKYEISRGTWPMAAGFSVRTAYMYDIDGPYARDLHDDDGNFLGHSPEWRGLLKEDYTFSYLVSRSILENRGWVNGELGYAFRTGSPADQVPFSLEVGVPVNVWNSHLKAAGLLVKSLNNDSNREPSDRFGQSARQNFNDASMGRLGLSAIIPIGRTGLSFEGGYNQWVWGRSARRYKEPFFSLNYAG